MFAAHCPGHNALTLYSPSQLTALVNTPAGIEVTVACDCGTTFNVVHAADAPGWAPAVALAA